MRRIIFLLGILLATIGVSAQQTVTVQAQNYQVSDNLDFGCYYIRYLLDKFCVLETALCAYNAGEGRVSSWLKDGRYSLDGITLYEIPFSETKAYLSKIKESLSKYKKLYGNLLDKRKNFE